MARQKQAHTHAPRGKRIYVVLKTGERFVDKFIERRPHHIVFAQRTVAVASIKSFTIYRPMPPHRPEPLKIFVRLFASSFTKEGWRAMNHTVIVEAT